MFKVAGKLMDTATNPAAILLTIWFHDAIYDSHAKDNEERSQRWPEICCGRWAFPMRCSGDLL